MTGKAPKAPVSVPVLELKRGGQSMLYSDKSVQKLACNDSTKYDKKSNVRKDYQDTCNRSIYLLNDKYRFKKYKEFDQDGKNYIEWVTKIRILIILNAFRIIK